MKLNIQQKQVANYNNKAIIEYQLLADNGFQINFINYGGIITAINTPDKNGIFANVVIANSQFDPQNSGHLGAITGRVAGRINNAQFVLGGHQYTLTANDGNHNLHGGPLGIDKQIWDVTTLDNGVELSYVSPALECGFPAQVTFKVRYLIQNDYQLTIVYNASCDAPTILNLTNHSYFDLTGGQDALRMSLQVPALFFAEIDTSGGVTGKIQSVENTPFDLRTSKVLGKQIELPHSQIAIANGGYDHPFILKSSPEPIILTDPVSQRYLQVTTDDPVCVVYTANQYKLRHAGVCLETQKMPNAINWPAFQNSVIFDPQNPYSSTTKWQFGILPDER